MIFNYFLRKKTRGNSIDDVKHRLLMTFSFIALTTSFLVFFAFSLRLVWNEDTQLESHLVSFKDIAIYHYQLEQVSSVSVSRHVTAYYDVGVLPEKISVLNPLPQDEVTRVRVYDSDGFLVYYQLFEYQGQQVPLYLTVDARAMDFGDDNWDVLMIIAMLLMIFLIAILRASLKRVFDSLMSPIADLSQQLRMEKEGDFTTSSHAIDEINQLTNHLNSYKKMKERLARQELMFAKYASHELKTPITVVLGAANLQGMKDDPKFQTRQRERILKAGKGMQDTIELLLNIVKQENVTTQQVFELNAEQINLSQYQDQLTSEVNLTLTVDSPCSMNLPITALNMVLKNLVENAIRFTESGAIKISISSDTIQVFDTGKGLHGASETEHGLGLLIVERICKSYGWQFDLQNNPNERGCLAELRRL